MIVKVRGHFDGRAIIPDEPLEVPINQPLEVQVTVQEQPLRRSMQEQNEAIRRLSERPISGLSIPDSALSREHIYEDD